MEINVHSGGRHLPQHNQQNNNKILLSDTKAEENIEKSVKQHEEGTTQRDTKMELRKEEKSRDRSTAAATATFVWHSGRRK